MMKIALLTIVLTTGFAANAEVYKCISKSKENRYLLVTDVANRTGSTFIASDVESESVNWQPANLNGSSKVTEDRSTLAIDGSADSAVDWSKEDKNKCYTVRAKYNFKISVSGQSAIDGTNGSLQKSGVVLVNPAKKNCVAPNLSRPPLESLYCQEL